MVSGSAGLADNATYALRAAPGLLHENRNVGGAGHDCGMSNPQTTGADICPALPPWLLTKAPLADISPQVHVR